MDSLKDELSSLLSYINKDLIAREERRRAEGRSLVHTVKTDLGNLTSANVQYLLDQRVLISIGEDYVLSNEKVHISGSDRPVLLYSLLCSAIEEIKATETNKYLNHILKVCREKYPNLSNARFSLVSKKKKDVNVSFDDLA